MAKTPENNILSGQTAKPVVPKQPEGPPSSADYPKMVFHKDSKPGALITKTVQSAAEEGELDDAWGPITSLTFETAPAAKEPGKEGD